jgi:hypothetical protein
MPSPQKFLWRALDDLGRGDLAGDLAEESYNGHGQLWLLRQLASGVAVTIFLRIRASKRLAIESVIVGWALLYILNFTTHHLIVGPVVLQVFRGTGLEPWGDCLGERA